MVFTDDAAGNVNYEHHHGTHLQAPAQSSLARSPLRSPLDLRNPIPPQALISLPPPSGRMRTTSRHSPMWCQAPYLWQSPAPSWWAWRGAGGFHRERPFQAGNARFPPAPCPTRPSSPCPRPLIPGPPQALSAPQPVSRWRPDGRSHSADHFNCTNARCKGGNCVCRREGVTQ